MSTSSITEALATELLQFLDSEDAFLAKLERCVAALRSQPAGQSFSNELIGQLTVIQTDTGPRNQQRATLQRRLAGELLKTPAAIRLSTVTTGSQITQQLQRRRQEVRLRAISVQTNLRTVLSQLMESNVIVTAVLDAVLGAPVDRSRYDSDGKRVSQISHIEGQRVA